VAIVVAVLIGVGNIVQAAVGTHIKVGGTRAGLGGAVIFGLVMLVCAVGMWRLRYWAVLGFQALLALIVVAFSLVLLTAGDILRALIALVVIVAGGYLFYKLVRVLSRLQMPRMQGRG
jgi:amino acid permease